MKVMYVLITFLGGLCSGFVNAHMRGSAHDSHVLDMSALGKILYQEGLDEFHLLGDSGYLFLLETYCTNTTLQSCTYWYQEHHRVCNWYSETAIQVRCFSPDHVVLHIFTLFHDFFHHLISSPFTYFDALSVCTSFLNDVLTHA